MRLNPEKIFSINHDNPDKNAWHSFTAVAQNLLGNFKAPRPMLTIATFLKQLLNSYKQLRRNMSVKIHFLYSHTNYFPENLGAMSEEQGELFHQDIKTMEGRYQGCWNANMMADYCWCLKR